MIWFKKIYNLLHKYWWPVIYVFIIFFLAPYNLSWYKVLVFYLYAASIFLLLNILIFDLKSKRNLKLRTIKSNKFFTYILICSLFFILLTRLFLFARFGEVALGYDSGFYIQAIKQAGLWNTTINFYRILVPFQLLGMSPSAVFYFMVVLSQFLIVGSLYFLVRSFKTVYNYQLASIAIFLFSVSMIQFHGYWLALGQQALATGFLLLTLALIMRRSLLFILTGVTTFLIHTPTFSLLAILLFCYIVYYLVFIFLKKERVNLKILSVFFLAILTVLLLFFLKQEKIFGEIEYLLNHGVLLKNYEPWKLNEARGLVAPLLSFRVLTLILLPLSIFGIFGHWAYKQNKYAAKYFLSISPVLYIITLALFVFTFSPVLYQGRFSIIFDLFLIIFASSTLFLILHYSFVSNRLWQIFASVLMVIFLINISFTVWEQKPLISKQELMEIKFFSRLLPPDAIIMSTDSSYTPWIYGFSGRDIIGPGHLYDRWSLEEWMNFWTGSDYNKKLQLLLTKRPTPLYIFVGGGQLTGQPYQDFLRTDSHFIQLTAHLWEFKPNL